MPQFETIEYTVHALERMRDRRVSHEDVEITLQFGEGRPGKAGTWVYELQSGSKVGTRVVVAESNGNARVITVIRLRRRS